MVWYQICQLILCLDLKTCCVGQNTLILFSLFLTASIPSKFSLFFSGFYFYISFVVVTLPFTTFAFIVTVRLEAYLIYH